MAFYKLCDCGTKNYFEHRGSAPRKCSNPECGRPLWDKSVVDEDLISDTEILDDIETDGDTDIALDDFYYSLDSADGEFSIKIPNSGCIIGRAAMGADFLAEHHAVSREHIRVTYRGKIGIMVEDISRFGTFINNENMEKGTRKLAREGDIIRLYNYEMIVKRHEEE